MIFNYSLSIQSEIQNGLYNHHNKRQIKCSIICYFHFVHDLILSTQSSCCNMNIRKYRYKIRADEGCIEGELRNEKMTLDMGLD